MIIQMHFQRIQLKGLSLDQGQGRRGHFEGDGDDKTRFLKNCMFKCQFIVFSFLS